jgi:hypothetical protein
MNGLMEHLYVCYELHTYCHCSLGLKVTISYVGMYVCMYVCMYKGWAMKSGPCTVTLNDLLCFLFD